MDAYNNDMFWVHFLDNFWWVLILVFIFAPIFNGGWILRVIVIGLVIYSIYRCFIVEDKYNSDRR